MQFTPVHFAAALKIALLLAHVPLDHVDQIVQDATAAIDFATTTQVMLMNYMTYVVAQAHTLNPAPAPAIVPAQQRVTEVQVKLILQPVVKAAIEACSPPFNAATWVAHWGPPVVTLVTAPGTIITSVRTVERIQLICADLRKKAPLTTAAICAGPIPRPAEAATAAAIAFVLKAYFVRLVRQYLYKVGEDALQANRAFSSTVPAALLDKILADLGEQTYVAHDIPAGSHAASRSTTVPPKRKR